MSPRRKREYRSLYVRLTATAKTALERMAEERGETMSDLVDRAIRDYLRATREGAKGITVPPTRSDLIVSRYNIDVDTDEAIERTRKAQGHKKQDIVRAALAKILGAA